MTETWWAAVGSDGTRPVVWGIGPSEEEALSDAAQWLDERDLAELETYKISKEHAQIIRDGDVSWPRSGAVTAGEVDDDGASS